MSELHVYTASEEEWVVAASPVDARDVYCAHIGCEPDEAPDQGTAYGGTHTDDWEALPDEQTLKIYDDETTHSKTCAGWVREHGRGYLCSANY